MGDYYILANSGDIPVPGGRVFVGQCISYLLGTDLVMFTAVGLGIIVFGIVVKAFINILED